MVVMPRIILEVFILFVLPVLLWYKKVVPTKYYIHVLAALNIAVLGIVLQERWSLSQLGINTSDYLVYWPAYLVFTFLALLVLFILVKFLRRRVASDWLIHPHFYIGFIFMSISQEFIFRAYLIPRLDIVFDSVTVILVNTFLFSLVHVIYPQMRINMPIIIVAGLFFASIYYYYPNLIAVSLSHMVLNYVAVLFGFFHFAPNRPSA